MQSESPSNPILLIGCLFFAGIGIGLGLTGLVAPHSEAAYFIGFFVLPISFAIGLSLWYTLVSGDFFSNLGKALLLSFQTGALHDSIIQSFSESRSDRMIDTTRIFVPISVLISFLAGCFVACCPNTVDYALVIPAYTVVGLLYSMSVTWIARKGYLPKPV